MFERELYFPQTEILKNFQLSAKNLKALFLINYLPVLSNLIPYGITIPSRRSTA